LQCSMNCILEKSFMLTRVLRLNGALLELAD
jgi:hypothetical protein